jgi:hypothetical protein
VLPVKWVNRWENIKYLRSNALTASSCILDGRCERSSINEILHDMQMNLNVLEELTGEAGKQTSAYVFILTLILPGWG